MTTNPPGDPGAERPDAEAPLIRAAREGDLDAFNALVELHQRAAFNLCLRMLGSHAAAEDATQDALLSAFRNINGFKGANFRPWLMRIAANACTDELRRRGRRPSLSLDTPPAGAEEPAEVEDRAAGPEALAIRHEQQAQIQAALLLLPGEQRMAVILCDIQGFSYDEIAAAMKTSAGTVKSRIARGREKLRRLLGDALERSGSRERP